MSIAVARRLGVLLALTAPLACAYELLPAGGLPVGSTPEVVLIGDVAGDAGEDLVVINSEYQGSPQDRLVRIYEQLPDHTLAEPVDLTYSTSSNPQPSAALADFDGDTRTDIVVAHAGGITLFRRETAGSWTSTVLPGGAYGIVAADDVDGDGHVDLVCSFRTLYGDGAGRFDRDVAHIPPPSARAARYRDVTDDGLPDLSFAVTHLGTPHLAVLPATGSGFGDPVFVEAVHQGDLALSLAIGDWNGDGHTDAVVTTSRPATYLLNRAASGEWMQGVPIPATFYPHHADVDDLDRDGHDDLLISYNDRFGYLLQWQGALDPEITVATYPHGRSATGDLNGDGCGDVAVPHQYGHVALLFGRDCGLSATTTTLTLPTQMYAGAPFVATAHAMLRGQPAPGTLSFALDGSIICDDVPVTGDGATCQFPPTPAGTYEFSAHFTPTAGSAVSTSDAVVEGIVKRVQSVLALTFSPSPGPPGPVTATVEVTPDIGQATTYVPTGTVSIAHGASSCTITLPQRTCTLSFSVPYTIQVYAYYSGDTQFWGATGSAFHTTVFPTTTTIVARTPEAVVVGQPYSVRVRVDNVQNAYYTGPARVTDGDAFCDVWFSHSENERACTLSSAPIGDRVITVSYAPASSSFAPSSTQTLQQVSPATTLIALSKPLAAVRRGTPIQVGSSLSVEAPGGGLPVGRVEVAVADATCSIEPVQVGGMTCAVVVNEPGVHSISTSFLPGNSDYLTSNDTSSVVVFAEADLSASIDNGRTTHTPGATTYVATFRNDGPDLASGLSLRVDMPTEVSEVAWVCTASGAACPAPSGSGAVNVPAATLGDGESLTFTVSGTVPENAGDVLSATARISMPVTVRDPSASGLEASDVDRAVAVFADGFE